MEKWDLYNKNKELLNIVHTRGDKIPDGCYHLVVHIWIKNSKGQYLISQRSPNKSTFPLMWENVGGAVISGETSLEAAIRETKEEVGIDLTNASGKLLFTQVRENLKNIMDVYEYEYNGEISLDNATTDEVCDMKWVTKEEIKKMLENGVFVKTLKYFID